MLRAAVIGASLVLVLALLGWAAGPVAASRATALPEVRAVASAALPASDAALVGLELDGGALVLGGDPLEHPGLADGRPSGLAVWDPIVVPDGARLASVRATTAGDVEVDVRTSPDGRAWSGWTSTSLGQTVDLGPGRFVQARAVLASGPSGPARLSAGALVFAPSPGGVELVAAAAAENPTVRLWASRQGMVGGRTANGRIIAEKDRFVALPSRRALASNGRNEYEVRLTYNGRQATAPVWDVGPWNTKDDYWSAPAERELFKDLPRFLPQVLAAWRDGYNGGRDQFGRWVTYPTAIDIADGTFLDDLGMRVSDWVDVTFLWVKAPAPAPLASYPRITTAKPDPARGAEQQAAAVEPPPGQRWYFAEGSTRAPFQTWLLLQNPAPQPAQVTVTYMLVDGGTRTQAVQLRPTSRQSIFANQVLPDAEFSTRVDSDRPIFAERAMYFRRDGHATPGVPRPETQWCTADGVTLDGADTWLLIQNPGSAPARVRVTFLLEGGGEPRSAALELLPTSRRSLYANLVVPDASFSACVEADQPVIVERATYPAGGGGSGGTAAPALSQTWYFAEGNTRPGIRTRLAIGNPNAEAARVELTYLPEGGEPLKRSLSVPPRAKVAVDANADLPGARFGLSLSASRPVVADRTMAFGPGGGGTHTSAGTPALARTWYLPEGSTAAPFQEYVLVVNPGATPANVAVDFMREDGTVTSRAFPVPAGGRLTVDANAEVPNAAVSVRVTADQPVVAERSMYWDDLAGGTNAAGIAWDR